MHVAQVDIKRLLTLQQRSLFAQQVKRVTEHLKIGLRKVLGARISYSSLSRFLVILNYFNIGSLQ